MANYHEAVHELLQIEGFLSDHPSDPGGKTAYGIAKEYWPEYWEDGPPTKEEAREFYREEFWEPLRLGEVHDQRVAYEIFEQAVNMGHRRAIRFAQQAHNMVCPVNSPWHDALVVDGRIGPNTLQGLNTMRWQDTIRWLKVMNGIQFSYYTYRAGYEDEVERLFRTTEDEDSQDFYRGWLRRVEFGRVSD